MTISKNRHLSEYEGYIGSVEFEEINVFEVLNFEVCVCVCARARTWIGALMRIYMYFCARVCLCLYECACACICMCVREDAYSCMC